MNSIPIIQCFGWKAIQNKSRLANFKLTKYALYGNFSKFDLNKKNAISCVFFICDVLHLIPTYLLPLKNVLKLSTSESKLSVLLKV